MTIESRRRRIVAELVGGYDPGVNPPAFDLGNLPPPNVPLVETIESSRGPWQQAGKYGRAENYGFPRVLDGTPTLIFNMDRQPGPPRARTLHLFRSNALLAFAGNADIYAQVTYGVGGVQNQAVFDWARGGQISLVCDSISVEAVAYTPNDQAYNPGAVGLRQILGAMLSHEGTSQARPPTFTTEQVTLLAGDNVSFVVPDFARWVFPGIVNNEFPAVSVADIGFESNAGFNIKSLSCAVALQQLGTPVPGGTRVVSVAWPATATGSASVILQFELGL